MIVAIVCKATLDLSPLSASSDALEVGSVIGTPRAFPARLLRIRTQGPGAYDAARAMLETTRRAELEAQAEEEARLTDAGERGKAPERVPAS